MRFCSIEPAGCWRSILAARNRVDCILGGYVRSGEDDSFTVEQLQHKYEGTWAMSLLERRRSELGL